MIFHLLSVVAFFFPLCGIVFSSRFQIEGKESATVQNTYQKVHQYEKINEASLIILIQVNRFELRLAANLIVSLTPYLENHPNIGVIAISLNDQRLCQDLYSLTYNSNDSFECWNISITTHPPPCQLSLIDSVHKTFKTDVLRVDSGSVFLSNPLSLLQKDSKADMIVSSNYFHNDRLLDSLTLDALLVRCNSVVYEYIPRINETNEKEDMKLVLALDDVSKKNFPLDAVVQGHLHLDLKHYIAKNSSVVLLTSPRSYYGSLLLPTVRESYLQRQGLWLLDERKKEVKMPFFGKIKSKFKRNELLVFAASICESLEKNAELFADGFETFDASLGEMKIGSAFEEEEIENSNYFKVTVTFECREEIPLEDKARFVLHVAIGSLGHISVSGVSNLEAKTDGKKRIYSATIKLLEAYLHELIKNFPTVFYLELAHDNEPLLNSIICKLPDSYFNNALATDNYAIEVSDWEREEDENVMTEEYAIENGLFVPYEESLVRPGLSDSKTKEKRGVVRKTKSGGFKGFRKAKSIARNVAMRVNKFLKQNTSIIFAALTIAASSILIPGWFGPLA